MRRVHLLIIPILLAGCMSVGCQRSSDEMWNDTKTAGRHVGRGVGTIGGKQGTSQQVKDGSEFSDNDSSGKPKRVGHPDFIGLDDDQERLALQMGGAESIPSPTESPGEPGSSIPGIEAFKDPALDPELAPIFEHVHFDYNSSLVKGDENQKILQNIADYLKNHPRMYVFLEGHCDKRGPLAYNFALGANRANSVRNFLVHEGVPYEHLFTISYGKEKPLFEEDGEEFQRLNRRVQFKIYEK
jgi:peptidoglycan-associated lipoprotein